MPLIAKYVLVQNEQETIVPDIAMITTDTDPLGLHVTCHLANGDEFTFGPVSPYDHTYENPPKVFITNDRGSTVGSYTLYPGSQEAWDEQAAIALTGTDPLFDEFGNTLSVEELHHLRTKMAQKPDLDGYPSPHREDKPYTLDTTSVTVDRIPGVSTNTISTTIERPRAPSGHPLT